MSGDLLRRAATGLRDEWSGGNEPRGTAWHRERDFHLAVADLLDAEADRHECLREHGARGLRTDGQVPNAFTVARAYPGEPS